MIKCGDDCHEICDFCIYLNKDKTLMDDEGDLLLWSGMGVCMKHNEIVSYADYCNDFHCFRARED